MTVKEYIEANGYEVSDLTKKDLKEVEKEVEALNRGEEIMDGFFSPIGDFIQRRIHNG